MRREDLAHILRSAARITADADILVIGSHAILGTFDEDELPVEAWRLVEADVAFFNDPVDAKSDQVDGAIGEDSRFHSTYGFYGQGVSITTAVLAAGAIDQGAFAGRGSSPRHRGSHKIRTDCRTMGIWPR